MGKSTLAESIHSKRVLQTNTSDKYFRKGKGVFAMAPVSNHVALVTTIISSNEYEGHRIFNLFMYFSIKHNYFNFKYSMKRKMG